MNEFIDKLVNGSVPEAAFTVFFVILLGAYVLRFAWDVIRNQ